MAKLTTLVVTAQKAVDLICAMRDQQAILAGTIELYYRSPPPSGPLGGGWGWKVSFATRKELAKCDKGEDTIAAVVLRNAETDPTRSRVWEIWADPEVAQVFFTTSPRRWQDRITKIDPWDLVREGALKQTKKRARGRFLSRHAPNPMMIRLPHR